MKSLKKVIIFIFFMFSTVFADLNPKYTDIDAKYKALTPRDDPNIERRPLHLLPGLQLYSLGYAQADFMTFGNKYLRDSANWRNGRILLDFDFVKKFDFLFGYNFAVRRYNELMFRFNVKNLTIDIGQMQPVFALVDAVAAPYFSFLEIPLVINAFRPRFRVGTQWTYHNAPINFSLGIYHPRIDYPPPGENGAVVANFVYAPFNTIRHVLLFNTAAMYEAVSSNPKLNPASFSPPPLTLPYDQSTLIAVSVPNSKNYVVSHNEVATTLGSMTLIGDYSFIRVNRVAGYPSANYRGWFILFNYFFTGESRVFSLMNASYLAITPIRHKYGAIELSLIYDYLSLMSANIVGGRETDYGISINWYPVPHANFRLQYVRAMAEPSNIGSNQFANIVALRMEIIW